MTEITRSVQPPAGHGRAFTASHGDTEKRWLLVMSAITAAELLWWAVAWSMGIAPAPRTGLYVCLALAALAGAVFLRVAFRLEPFGARGPDVAVATVLVGIGASAFLPLKYAIPKEIPFWLDAPLASAEHAIFRNDPWLLLDRTLGWATAPVDWLYGCWLPVQLLALFAVILSKPSAAKSRLLIAYSAAWFLLGIAGATLLSSAGPLFYDRLLGGESFATLDTTLRARGAWVALAEADRVWASFAGSPGLVAGISAAPSMHVAISFWMYLAARAMAPRAAKLALAYFLFMWIASVQLGWHYAADGLAGMLGMLAVWRLSGVVDQRLEILAHRGPKKMAERRSAPPFPLAPSIHHQATAACGSGSETSSGSRST
jgi:hypothetical protein